MFQTWLGIVLALLVEASAFAQSPTIFLVRHAERADTAAGISMTDPSLSDAGRLRAGSLERMLRDAGISAIFVTEFKRTQETAAPLAKTAGVTPTVITSKEVPALVAKLKQHAGRALVVGHSNSVPEIIKALGVTTPVTIADTEFDNLFIVNPDTGHLIQLRYQ